MQKEICGKLKQEFLAISEEMKIIDVNISKPLGKNKAADLMDLKIKIKKDFENLIEEIYQAEFNIDLRRQIAERYNADFVSNFKMGFARVFFDNSSNYFDVDTKGERLISDNLVTQPEEEKNMIFFDKQLTIVKNEGKSFFIDNKGKRVGTDFYDTAHNFYCGTARVRKGNQWFYIDRHCKRIFPGKDPFML